MSGGYNISTRTSTWLLNAFVVSPGPVSQLAGDVLGLSDSNPLPAPYAIGLAPRTVGMIASGWLGKVILLPRDLVLVMLASHGRVFLLHHVLDTLDWYVLDSHYFVLLLGRASCALLLLGLGTSDSDTDLLKPTAGDGAASADLGKTASSTCLLAGLVDVDGAHVEALPRLDAVWVVAGSQLLHVRQTLTVVVVVGAQVVLIVDLAWVAFVADGAVEEAHSRGEGVVARRHLEVVRSGAIVSW
jgi:hypothetical protein